MAVGGRTAISEIIKKKQCLILLGLSQVFYVQTISTKTLSASALAWREKEREREREREREIVPVDV
eukprot:16436817-Heterocapsa_arctica.AAC.1